MKRSDIMSKIINVALILLLSITMLGKVYGLSECNINLSTNKNKLKKNDSFTIDVSVSDIKSEMGVTAFGTTLEYDKESLEIENIEGQNDWETPTNGLTFNAENGKIAITKSGFAKKNETIFSITFKVREESKKNLSVILADTTASDGMELIRVGEKYVDVTVKNGKENEKIKHNDDSTKKGGINIWIVLLIIALIIVVIVFYNNVKPHKRKRKNKTYHK